MEIWLSESVWSSFCACDSFFYITDIWRVINSHSINQYYSYRTLHENISYCDGSVYVCDCWFSWWTSVTVYRPAIHTPTSSCDPSTTPSAAVPRATPLPPVTPKSRASATCGVWTMRTTRTTSVAIAATGRAANMCMRQVYRHRDNGQVCRINGLSTNATSTECRLPTTSPSIGRSSKVSTTAVYRR